MSNFSVIKTRILTISVLKNGLQKYKIDEILIFNIYYYNKMLKSS